MVSARLMLVAVAVLAAGVPGRAADQEAFFRDRVAPLLASRCGGCHGPHAAESGFRIDVREQAMKGGESGQVGIVAGKPAQSELYERIVTADKESVMPAEGPPLTAEERAIVNDWIAAGAAWPDDIRTLPASLLPVRAADAQAAPAGSHWAFQPVKRPDVPRGGGGPPTGPIDAFLQEKLAAKSLGFGPEADPRTLIRRVSFDLIGLPPTPEEITAFETACRQDGVDGPYLELVNRLLASPHHGERWARHWLDVVRFAESHGFEANGFRPNAWPYRDWVIAAFNEDKPFDRFVREQIAGDTLGADAATGFLVGGPTDEVKSPDVVLTASQRADELHDMVSTTASAFLGLTVGCARCHDHKFDPVPQADYYRIKAVFEGVRHGERPVVGPGQDAVRQQIADLERTIATATARLAELRSPPGGAGTHPRPPVTPRENVDPFPVVRGRFLRFTVLATAENAEPCLDELEVFSPDGVNIARGAKPTASSGLPGFEIHKIEHVNDGQYGNDRSWIAGTRGTGWVQLEFPERVAMQRVVWSRDRSPMPRYADRLPLRYAIAVSDDGMTWRSVASDKDRGPAAGAATTPERGLESLPPAERAEAESLQSEVAVATREMSRLRDAGKAYVGLFEKPAVTHRFFRGDPLAPREAVPPGSLSRLGRPLSLSGNAPEKERRAALAEWIAAAENPLTARVIVNRLWHYHFGTGIVDTPSDLGINGGQPSHPELLDWLAAELVSSGWRLKHVHRLIVTSRAYRQSSAVRRDALAIDSDTRLLWRYPPRRLEAEPLRDAILAVSGSLNRRMGGPGFDLLDHKRNQQITVYVPRETFTENEFRRMVYQAKPRSELDSFFGAFDCPDAGQVQPRRTVSTTPLQALNMLNGAFLLDQAKRFANRVRQEVGDDPALQVRRAMLLAFGREPTAAEGEAGRALVERHGLPMLCRSLYNAGEFITVR